MLLRILTCAGLACALTALIASANPPAVVVRAQLLPVRFTTLSSELSAKIGALPLKEGDRFAQNALLVELDDSLPRAQLQRAQAELQFARVALQSNTDLAKLSSVGKVELEQTRAAVARAEAELAAAQSLLSKCRILAPFDGRIAEQKVRELQFVQAGQPLLEIIDDSALELEFIVPSPWLGWLKEGDTFEVSVDETGSTYSATVRRIGARVDPVSQTIKINASIESRAPELLAGMSGRVTLRPPAS